MHRALIASCISGPIAYLILVLHCFFFNSSADPRDLHSFPTRRSSDLGAKPQPQSSASAANCSSQFPMTIWMPDRSEEHTSELQSHSDLVCRLLLEKKKLIVQ